MTRRQGVTAVLLVLAALIVGSPALAQDAGDPTVDFVVTPSRLEVRAGPGEVLEIPIRVYNRGAQPLMLFTYVEDIEIADNDLVETDELAFTASRWTHFNAATLEVPANGQAEARVRISVPAGTPTGGYHAFAFFQSQVIDDQGLIVPSGRIGATLLLDVALAGAELAREARVTETALDVRWAGFFNPVVDARTTVDNIGEAHVMAGGLHTYRSFPGPGAADVEIGPQTILRGTRYTFYSSFDAVPLIGKVTLTSELVYQVGPDEIPVILTQATVWVIPWHLIAVLLLVAAGLTTLLWWWRRHNNDRRKPTYVVPWRQDQEPSTTETSWLDDDALVE